MKKVVGAMLFSGYLLTAPFATELWADPATVGVRLAGGDALTLDVAGAAVTDIPTSFEILYFVSPGVQVSLGVFPTFLESKSAYYNRYSYFNGIGTTTNIISSTSDISTTLYPIMASVYLRQDLGSVFNVFAGAGLGWVPASSAANKWTRYLSDTSVPSEPSDSVSNNQGTENRSYDRAAAFRGVMGVDAAVAPHLRLGAQIQMMMVGGIHQDNSPACNQVAPMLFLEADL